MDTWDTVLEPFDQDKEENDNREGDDAGKGDEDNDETINLEEEEGVKARKLGKWTDRPLGKKWLRTWSITSASGLGVRIA